MTADARAIWRSVLRRRRRAAPQTVQLAPGQTAAGDAPPIDIAPNDPLVAYLQQAGSAVDIRELQLDSPALQAMKEANIQLVVPLVSQGELIGLLNLGPRLSQQDYSADDRTLLNNLAAQATPAVRVAQLVRQQEAEAEERQRIEQELQIARLIQHTLLPKSVPDVEGWHLAAHYRPARAVGGDFYDFLEFEDGRLGIIVGDVTDKGVPAALVMATTRSVMRAAAGRLTSPGAVLQRANNIIVPDIPANMFVTCLYAVLDPVSGRLEYANAGHDLPYRQTEDGVVELRARGMPLGLMPDMTYEECETQLRPGDTVLFYSDGLVEAHDPDREMFGFPRLREMLASHPSDDAGELVDFLLDRLAMFTGPAWEQEDDITLVTVHRAGNPARLTSFAREMLETEDSRSAGEWGIVTSFSLPSEVGNERVAMDRVREALEPLGLPTRTLDNLGTAVAEATMNAMEHGNRYQADVPVAIAVEASSGAVAVSITDRGDNPIRLDSETPDLEKKLEMAQTPRGWGLFLIQNMVDDVQVSTGDSGHTIRLIVHREGVDDVTQSS